MTDDADPRDRRASTMALGALKASVHIIDQVSFSFQLRRITTFSIVNPSGMVSVTVIA